MRAWLIRTLICSALATLGGGAGCSCNKPADPCPAAFTVGELCPAAGLTCTWPESKCKTTVCTCENASGGFYWKCSTSWCVCTCPCGYTARVGCEALECESKPEDACPAAVDDICKLVCTQPDAGHRDGPARDGPARDRPGKDGPEKDGPQDARGEASPDTSLDGPPVDTTTPDRASDRTSGEHRAE